MYAGIFVLAVALIALVLWVSRISSKYVALKQAFMIEQRRLEELELQLGIDVSHKPALTGVEYEAPPVSEGPKKRKSASGSDSKTITLQRGKRHDAVEPPDGGATGEIEFVDAYIEDASDPDAEAVQSMMQITDAQSLRQQEQMRRVSRARERQAKLKQKHSEEKAAEQRRKQEIARRRDEQVRQFQKQQEALRQRIAQEQAEQAAEEERLNKLRTRASWAESYAGTGSSRPRQRVRLEERRQAQLRKQAEEILQKTRLNGSSGTLRGTDYYDT